jgi:hypothetical protein
VDHRHLALPLLAALGALLAQARNQGQPVA